MTVDCTCGADPGALHSIICMTATVGQPHAMVDADGGVFYPDNREDAEWFAEHQGARPIDPAAFEACFAEDPPP